jgi:hypothetical protein
VEAFAEWSAFQKSSKVSSQKTVRESSMISFFNMSIFCKKAKANLLKPMTEGLIPESRITDW